jgi:hypothetical protein
MSISKLDVINSALTNIGQDALADLNQRGKVGTACRLKYPLCRRALLRQYNWNFAVRRGNAGPIDGGAEFGFDNKFRLPDDCLRVIGLYDANDPESQRNYTGSTTPFKVEGRFIYADGDIVYFFYIADVEEAGDFDPLFVDALSWKLAQNITYAIANGTDHVATCAAGLKQALRDAKFADAIEGTPEVLESSDWLDARNTGGGAGPFRAGPIN